MTPWQTLAGAQRDRALERLRNLTVATAVGATGLAAVLSMVAAWSIPGQASSRASNPANGLDTSQGASADPSPSQGLTQDQQNPVSGPIGGGAGNPVSVSGGSHT